MSAEKGHNGARSPSVLPRNLGTGLKSAPATAGAHEVGLTISPASELQDRRRRPGFITGAHLVMKGWLLVVQEVEQAGEAPGGVLEKEMDRMGPTLPWR